MPLRSPTTILSAPPSAEIDLLDVVHVHRDVGDVAEEQRAAAIGRDVDVLGDVGAEEQHFVEAVLTFDCVVAVAGVPLEHIVARAKESDVVAVVTEDEVVAVAGQHDVGALAAEHGVVARPGVDRELDHAGRQGGGGDAVVAAQRVDDQRVVRALRLGDVDLGREPDHRNRAAGAHHIDDIVAVGAVGDHRVGGAIARHPADRPRQADIQLRDVGAREIVHRECVDAAQRVEVDALDVVEVHDDVAEVAGEHHPPAVG